MRHGTFLLVDSSALPRVYSGVAEAKRMLEAKEVPSAAEAARKCGISRSAFYKYRDYVFPYPQSGGETLNFELRLNDEPGVLSRLLGVLSKFGANVLTVNQSLPRSGQATVSVSVSAGNLTVGRERLFGEIADVEGVISVQSGESG